jgi:hypothetical protein
LFPLDPYRISCHSSVVKVPAQRRATAPGATLQW